MKMDRMGEMGPDMMGQGQGMMDQGMNGQGPMDQGMDRGMAENGRGSGNQQRDGR
jgi:hypothetical protein